MEDYKREVCECEGWVWDLDAIGAPSKLRTIRKAAALARARPTLLFIPERKAAQRKWKNPPLVDCADWTPEAAKKRSVSRWGCKNKRLTNWLCNLPLVLAIAGINDTARFITFQWHNLDVILLCYYVVIIRNQNYFSVTQVTVVKIDPREKLENLKSWLEEGWSDENEWTETVVWKTEYEVRRNRNWSDSIWEPGWFK